MVSLRKIVLVAVRGMNHRAGHVPIRWTGGTVEIVEPSGRPPLPGSLSRQGYGDHACG